MEEYLGEFLNKRARGYLAGLSTPVYSIDSKLYPTNIASNKKYIQNYDVTYIDDAGHFLMLEKPALFNETLDRIVKNWTKSREFRGHDELARV
jgi:pimeloyl-ACP methyl ester carboxylesterase